MLLLDHQRFWTTTIGGHPNSYNRDLNAVGQWISSTSCIIVNASCKPANLQILDGPSEYHSQGKRHNSSWGKNLRDCTFRCDGGLDKKSSRTPDVKHKDSKGLLCRSTLYKPAGMDVQGTALDTWIGRPARNPALQDNPSLPTVTGHVTTQTVSKLCEKGQLSAAVDALTVLVQKKSRVPVSLLYSVLKICVSKKNLVMGRQVHYLVVELGYESNAFLSNHILRMYACQGRLQEAMSVFTRVGKPNAFMWFSVISTYARHGKPSQAIQLYHDMRNSGVKPDGHVFVAALQACAMAADLESGRQVHADVLGSGVTPDSFVCNSLVDMYAKCGDLEAARSVFDSLAIRDVVTWTAMISGYSECGQLEDARRLFDSLATKNVVTWNAMISGYAEHGFGQEALALYSRMEQDGFILADGCTFACLLKACASVGAIQKGRHLHSQILKSRELEGNIVVGNCLVDMYAKCGKLEDARRAFDSLARRDVVTWTAMISGYGRSNAGHSAIACFEEMLLAGVQPNDTTFTCLLVACSQEGLVNEGRKYFNDMVEQHGVMPTVEHYNCMIDLLGRAGHLIEAENILLSCESRNHIVGLRSLLNACRTHGDIERGTWCFKSLVALDPQHSSAYVLMANMYADAGRWMDVERTERMRKLAGASKKPAVAGIEVNQQVHTFLVGEERGDISGKVRSTNERLKEEGGHVPHTKLVLKPLSEKEKEDDLCGHAEKLALAYGLLNTPNGTPLLVTKNLRMCRDCHTSTEIMSRIEKRDIVVRDAYRVHRFEAGSCSCKGRP